MSSQKKPQQSRFSVKICALLLGLCLTAGIGAGAASAEETVPNKLQNGSFEEEQTWTGSYKQPNQKDVPSWNTTATDGKIELFQENTGVYIKNVTLAPTDGSIAAELNAEEESTLYQNVKTSPSSIYEWGLDHGARNGTDTMALVIGPAQIVAPSKPGKDGGSVHADGGLAERSVRRGRPPCAGRHGPGPARHRLQQEICRQRHF